MLSTIFLIAAVVGGTVMVCQFLMMIVGMGDDMSADVGGDVDLGGDVSDISVDADLGADMADADHHTTWSHAADADIGHPDASRLFEVLSFRSVVAAITFFGLGGKAALASGMSETNSLLIALVAGAAAMYGIYWTMTQIYKLRSAGNQDIRNALGQPASVYVAIPGRREGMGKVQMQLQNRTVEYQAVTEHDATLKSGEQVLVVEVLGPDKVLVSADTPPVEAIV